ncbi:MAG: PQQ-binding-like beta-propeller repeat protein [Candidatus Bathyarchaeia archaeon]
MKPQKNAIVALAIIALVLIVSISALAPVKAAETQTTKAYITAFPNPVGVGQTIGLDFWIHPYPPGALLDVHGFKVTITKPDGTTETKGPYDAFKSSSSYTSYVPTMVGTYKFTFTYPGETYFNGSLTYLPSSDTINVNVTAEPAPLWPEFPFTNDYWTRPLNAAMRNWYNVAGPWLAQEGERGNEWSPDVKTPHVMWKVPIDIGGVVGGKMGISNYYEGSAYEAKGGTSIIIGGYYINSGFRIGQRTTGGTKCYDLRTGELKWYVENMSINFAWQMRVDSGNLHAIIPYLVQTGSTYRFYDPLSGKALFELANASSPTASYWTYTPQDPVWPTTDDGTWPGTWFVYLFGNTARGSWLAMWNSTKCIEDNGWITYQSNNRMTSLATWAPPGTPGAVPGDWRKGIMWNVSSPAQWGYQITQIPADGNLTNWPRSYLTATTIDRDAGVLIATINANGIDNGAFAGWSLKTGQLLWTKNITDISYLSKYYTAGGGKYVIYALVENYYVVLDSLTGNELFRTDVLPGGGYSTYNNAPTIYKGVLYTITYNGYVITHDLSNGKLKWATQIKPFNSESPYEGGQPMRAAPVFSQNLLYVMDQVKTDENPMRRNQGTSALNIETGEVVWKVYIGPGGESSSIIGVADGYLATYGGFTSERYILGKGPSKTTVSAPQTAIPKGQSVVITGTITDQSTALKDTPCIADVNMADWMQYMFLQWPFPADAKGVPITLTATGSDGQTITIVNDLLSSASGTFGYMWTPPAAGLWTVTATFRGTDSYGSSYAQTYVGVETAPPAAQPVSTPAPTQAQPAVTQSEATPTAAAPLPTPSIAPPPTETSNTMLYVEIAAVVVVVAVVAAAVLLRRRK